MTDFNLAQETHKRSQAESKLCKTNEVMSKFTGSIIDPRWDRVNLKTTTTTKMDFV